MPLLTVLLAATIIATYWVVRDARARGMNAVGWGVLMLCTSLLALPVYLVMRKPMPVS